MQEIPGWLTIGEAQKLAELATNKKVLEIGSYCGRSTVAMGRVCKTLLSIDPHNSATTEPHPPRETYEEFRRNVVDLPVCCLIGVIEDIEKYLPHQYYDFIFIDGDHSYNACLRDIAIARSIIVPGGRIAIHDYGTPYPQLADVTKAVKSLNLPFDTHESLAIL